MRLAFREKVVLGLGSLLGVMILSYTLIITPYMEKMRDLDRRIAQKTIELKEISTLSQEYLEIKEKMEELKGKARRRGKAFSLFSHLESLAGKTRIKGNIASMKPQSTPIGEHYKESSVAVKLENITTKQLVDYLFLIENSEAFLQIKKLHLKKRHDNPKYLDATFLISTYETSEGK
ncbi:MAG: type II secretion system protein M [Syntrophobacterales bacterium]|nr:MAG: type II secretion system protein M [Syntrophobacterales bacterium]